MDVRQHAGWVAAAALVALTTACSAPAADQHPTDAAPHAMYGPSVPSTGRATTPVVTAPVAPTASTDDLFTAAGAATITAGRDTVSWLAWSLVDRSTGRRTGSANSATERTNAESSIKAWIATDHLRRLAGRGVQPSSGDMALISAAIRSSDDDAAETLYRATGGDQVLADLAPVCGVTVSTSQQGYWSFAQITARDATTILDCTLKRAPGYPGGATLVSDLRSVDAADRFGIPEALPPGTPVAVKNGWTQHGGTGLWNVNCVAAWSHYTLAVMTRYPASESLDVGSGACVAVTRQILAGLR